MRATLKIKNILKIVQDTHDEVETRNIFQKELFLFSDNSVLCNEFNNGN